MRVNKESEKAGLKYSFKKKIQYHGIPHYFIANRWGKVETVADFISWAPKSLWTVTAALKLKFDA